MLFIEATRDDAVLLQRLEAGRQRVGADAGKRQLQVLELAGALQKQIAKNENGPALADYGERARHRAVSVIPRRHPAVLRPAPSAPPRRPSIGDQHNART